MCLESSSAQSCFLPPIHTLALGLAGSREEADPTVYGAFETLWSSSPDAWTWNTVFRTNDHLASILIPQGWGTYFQVGGVSTQEDREKG